MTDKEYWEWCNKEGRISATAKIVGEIIDPYWSKFVGGTLRFGQIGFKADIRGHYDMKDGSIAISIEDNNIVITAARTGQPLNIWAYTLANPMSLDKVHDKIREILRISL
jgi:hypothetical protein